MRTRATLSGIFASVAILVVGWQAGSAAVTAANTTASSTTSSGTSTTSTGTGTPSSTTPAPAASSAATPAKTAASGSFTGSSVDTRFGSVQVQVVVSAGKITDVKALHLTDDGGRSVQISNYAAPILRSEVLKSQSAQVSTVGGATYTSDAYLTSLQSALDQAGI
ncbi:FMN-binding protein [Lacisediminihabitans sp. FW035]